MLCRLVVILHKAILCGPVYLHHKICIFLLHMWHAHFVACSLTPNLQSTDCSRGLKFLYGSLCNSRRKNFHLWTPRIRISDDQKIFTGGKQSTFMVCQGFGDNVGQLRLTPWCISFILMAYPQFRSSSATPHGTTEVTPAVQPQDFDKTTRQIQLPSFL